MNKLFNRFLVILGTVFLFTTFLVSFSSESNNSNLDKTSFVYNSVDEARQVFGFSTTLEIEDEISLFPLNIIVNNEKSHTLEVNYGTSIIDAVASIIEPERHGFVFAGWSLDGIEEITTQTMSQETTSVLALWNEIIINGDALHLFNNLIDDVLITRNMDEEDIRTLINDLINETKDASHFNVDIKFLDNNDISITISRILINISNFYGDTQEQIPSDFLLPIIYLDMTHDEILELIQEALGVNFVNFRIEISNYHTQDLEIVIIFNRITGNMIFGDVITSGRIPYYLINEMRIFADFDRREIENEVRRVLDVYAESTSRLNLRGANFNVGVFGEGTRAITITLSRIPLTGIIPTGTAIPRLADLNIGTLYQDMADYEINEQIALAMLSLNQSNLVFNNFNILLDNVNTTNLSIEINRISITHQFSGNASDAVTGLLINNLFKDLSDSEIIYLVNQSIDNSQELWFNHDALNLAVVDINENFVNLQFTHITRNISLTGDAILELNLSSEYFNLNMTMDNDAIRYRVLYIIMQSGGNLSHLEEILLEYTLIVNAYINFRWAQIYIDLNLESDPIFELDFTPFIEGAEYDFLAGQFYVRARFGLDLQDVLQTLTISSMAHANPLFDTSSNDNVVEDSAINVSIIWGELQRFNIHLTVWTLSDDIRASMAGHSALTVRENGDIILEYNAEFGVTPQEFVLSMLEDFGFDLYTLDQIEMFISDAEGFLRSVNLEGVLIEEVNAYISINYRLRTLTFEIEVGDFFEYHDVTLRYNDLIYDVLMSFYHTFYYSKPGYAIEGWRIFFENGDNEWYYILNPNLRMPNANIKAVAIYRALTQYNVNIVFDEDINVEVLFEGEDINGQLIDNVVTLRIFENSVVLNILRNLLIYRQGFELSNFIFENGNILTTDFRMPKDDVTFYVTWELISRLIIFELNIPQDAITNEVPNILPILVEYGQSISEAMGDLYQLNDLLSHYFVGWTFISWIGGDIFNGSYMPHFDIIAEAQWNVSEFTVWLFGNGGTINEENHVELRIPFGVNLLEHLDYLIDFSTAFYKYTYNFSFFTDSLGRIIPSDMTMPANNLDLHISWTEYEYQITFILNDGTLPGFNGNESVTIFTTYIRFKNEFLDVMIPERQGYIFLGWLYFGNDTYGEIVDRETIFPNVGEILVLHAYWNEADNANLTLTIVSNQTSTLFNGSNSITFENIENVTSEQEFINLLISFRRAYNSVNGTTASNFLGTPIIYVPGVSLVDFHTGNNVNIINENAFGMEIMGHIRLYTVENHYNQDTTSNIQLQTNENGEQVGVIVSPGWSGNQDFTDLVFPTFVNGVPVTEVSSGAYGWRDITGILVLPRYVEIIGDGAFQGNNLSSINIEDLPNLHTIGSNAFNQSRVATSIVLRDLPSLRTIGNNAFLQNNLVTEVTIDNLPSLVSVGVGAFGNSRNGQIFNLRDINPEAVFANGFISGWFNNIRVNLLGDWSVTPLWWSNRFNVFNNHTSFFNEVGTNITNAERPQ